MAEETPMPVVRRWLRLSVRTLMLLVLFMGAALGWIAHIVHRAEVQREAVAAVATAGGWVVYDWQRGPDERWAPRAKPWWPRWLIDRIGIDYFGTVVEVHFGAITSDAGFARIGHLARVEVLSCWVGNGTVTNGGMAHIQSLTRLRHLDLHHTQISDGGLVYLGRLSRLQELDLSHTRITAAGLAHLVALNDLRSLNLSATEVGGPGVVHLRKLSNLRSLDLTSTRVDDCDAQSLRKALPSTNIKFTPLQFTH
jgi:Leucine Rich repeat